MNINVDNIRDLLQREPFVPFRVILSSGTHYDVVNPGLVMVLKFELFIAFADGERWAHVPFQQIAVIETLKNGQAPKSTHRKRRQ